MRRFDLFVSWCDTTHITYRHRTINDVARFMPIDLTAGAWRGIQSLMVGEVFAVTYGDITWTVKRVL